MAKAGGNGSSRPARKPLVWLQGEVKSPPFTREGRLEAGLLLRLLQEGEQLGMPHARRLADVGPRCGELRIRDASHNWRIIYRVDDDAILVVEVFEKKTQKLPKAVINRCQKRLIAYDEAVRAAGENPEPS